MNFNNYFNWDDFLIKFLLVSFAYLVFYSPAIQSQPNTQSNTRPTTQETVSFSPPIKDARSILKKYSPNFEKDDKTTQHALKEYLLNSKLNQSLSSDSSSLKERQAFVYNFKDFSIDSLITFFSDNQKEHNIKEKNISQLKTMLKAKQAELNYINKTINFLEFKLLDDKSNAYDKWKSKILKLATIQENNQQLINLIFKELRHQKQLQQLRFKEQVVIRDALKKRFLLTKTKPDSQQFLDYYFSYLTPLTDSSSRSIHYLVESFSDIDSSITQLISSLERLKNNANSLKYSSISDDSNSKFEEFHILLDRREKDIQSIQDRFKLQLSKHQSHHTRILYFRHLITQLKASLTAEELETISSKLTPIQADYDTLTDLHSTNSQMITPYTNKMGRLIELFNDTRSSLNAAHTAYSQPQFNPNSGILGISPYIGYHKFNTDRQFKDSVEIGLMGTGYITDEFALQAQIGSVQTYQINETSDKKSITPYGLSLLYFLDSAPSDKFYISAGLNTDPIFNKTEFSLGAGFRFNSNLNFSTLLDIKQSHDSKAHVGIEKHINIFNDPNHRPQTDVSVRLKTAPTLHHNIQDDPLSINILDIKTHWAKESIKALAWTKISDVFPADNSDQLTTNHFFYPEHPMSHLMAGKMIVKAIEHVNSHNQLYPIHFSLQGKNNTYLVDIIIQNASGEIVKVIYDDQPLDVGDHTAIWDGSDTKDIFVDSGVYTIGCFVKSPDSKSNDTTYLATQYNKVAVLDTVSDTIPDHFYSSTYYPQKDPMVSSIEEKLHPYGLFQSQSFEPDTLITRIDFVHELYNTLSFLGIDSSPNADPLPYKDIESLPEHLRSSLRHYFYIIFPDDSQTTFRPYQLITRAEATVFLDRLVKKF